MNLRKYLSASCRSWEVSVGLFYVVIERRASLLRLERLPQLPLLDAVLNTSDPLLSQLRVPESRHRVVLVSAVKDLSLRCDVSLDQTHAERLEYLPASSVLAVLVRP